MAAPRHILAPHLITERLREKVVLRARSFLIERPADMEELIDRPEVRAAFADDEYLPYWADVWPAARMLARAILETKVLPASAALELGCGLGVAGLAALSRGVRVTFSDYDSTAVRFAEHNARINGFVSFDAHPFDWRYPPDALEADWIFGSDLLYEERNHEPLFATLRTILSDGGQAWLTDPDRPAAPRFLDLLRSNGWIHDSAKVRAGSPGQRRIRGTLYRIRKAPQEEPRTK